MDFDLKSLELFVRVARLGAIGKAGTELGLSRTAASQRIQDLEAVVGTQLLHRTTRSVSLSVDGEAFLVHAKRILQDVEDALSDLQSDPHAIGGTLRVAGSASFGRKYLAPFVAEFLDLYPKLSLHLHLSDAPFDIVDYGFDLAIRLGNLTPSTLKARRIGESPRIAVAAPTYLERYGTPQVPAALEHHNCLIRSDLRNWVTRGPDGRIEEVKVSGNFATNLAEAVTEAALTGVGIARKCRWEIDEHLASGALVPVLPDHFVVPEWGIHAVRSPSRTPPARVRAFTDFIARKFQKIPELN
ncbi:MULTISPECIES: LysR family transcriptional regulator [unclassified Ruegeria]|uniref:LysR family transcriptional regulator n=1 Tax=unclassified Ruegeria TaxID=2625375 RepID=UPI001488F39A|nr:MULTISPECIES: LysR family transcriptional regulator [unclassified Ruegeria]NOD77601.1 LysR family transcriptional regulator [Ruegeria sp. HKCCD4332]